MNIHKSTYALTAFRLIFFSFQVKSIRILMVFGLNFEEKNLSKMLLTALKRKTV